MRAYARINHAQGSQIVVASRKQIVIGRDSSRKSLVVVVVMSQVLGWRQDGSVRFGVARDLFSLYAAGGANYLSLQLLLLLLLLNSIDLVSFGDNPCRFCEFRVSSCLQTTVCARMTQCDPIARAHYVTRWALGRLRMQMFASCGSRTMINCAKFATLCA